MEARLPESFLSVVDCSSIAEAARRPNLSPAALAQRLHKPQRICPTARDARGEAGATDGGSAGAARPARQLIRGARASRAIAAQDEIAGQVRLGEDGTPVAEICREERISPPPGPSAGARRAVAVLGAAAMFR
ncbi:hypothetical protein MASR2M74_02600 [Paracoccaceae bacterium]